MSADVASTPSIDKSPSCPTPGCSIESENDERSITMFRMTVAIALIFCSTGPAAFGQLAEPAWHMVYTRSHRATFEQEWKYTFPNHKSRHWFIALRYPPELAWSRDVVGKAELRTSAGWKPFREVLDESRERRRMLVIDHPHDDPLLRKGFTV